MPRFDKLLILDLDETLVYTTDQSMGRGPDFHTIGFPVYKRPGVDGFLARCVEWFELAIWTSASEDYAQGILEGLFTDLEVLSFVWTRDRCVRKLDPDLGGFCYLKDLRKLRRRGYSLEKILIIDDTPATARLNYGNIVPVAKYTGSIDDDELPSLLTFLEELGREENVRTIEKRGWRLRTLELLPDPEATR
ncbi:MAG: HAD family hydrolase [Candidatus Riflebacteria bacterium]|nr:HAD family hydrolase [Candidatus Riflebacteria bacterium]